MAVETRFAQNLDVQNPLAFVQAEAYSKGRAETFEWLLNFPEVFATSNNSEK